MKVLLVLLLFYQSLQGISCNLAKIKLEFLSEIIASNHAKINLHLSSWKKHDLATLFKHSSKYLKSDPRPAILKERTLNIYDLTGRNGPLQIPADNNPKLVFLEENASVEAVLKNTDALPGRNIFTAKTYPIGAGENFLVKISRCYRLVDEPPATINEEYILTWRPGQNVSLNLDGIKRARANFNGRKLPVAIVLTSHSSLPRLEDFRDQWTDTYAKANYGPIMKLFEYFNITPEFKVVHNFKHLESSENKKYLLTVSAPYMTKNLLAHIDFLKVTPPTKLSYTLKRPPTSFVTTIFTVTFSPGVWYATLGLLAILSGALYFFLNMETRRHDIKGVTSFSVYDLMLIGLEAICQQGTSTDPLSYASRTLQVFMFMAYMFLYVAYSANILVLLQSTTALTNRNQLLEFGVDYAGMNTSSFNYYTPETGERIFKEDADAAALQSVEDGMERVRRGIFAFYLESRYGSMYARDHFSDYEICGMQEFEEKYDFGMGYAAIAKNSGYTDMFKVALNQINEQGFSARHYLRYFLKPECFSQGSSYDTIGIREIYQAIVLVAIGVGAGLLVLLLEILLYKVKERRALMVAEFAK